MDKFIQISILFLSYFLLLTHGHEPEEVFEEHELEPGGESHCPQLYKQRAVCTIFPESVEGPFYREKQAVRRDVREGKPGIPITITVTLAEVSSCKPVPNVAVDIWSADAMGEYSAFVGVRPGDPPNPRDNGTFLRGVQRSDNKGKLTFITIFPGWYPGRTIHFHMGIHLKDKRHSVQLFVDERTSARVARTPPYSDNENERTTNSEDDYYKKAAELKLKRDSRGYRAEVLMAFRIRRKK